jgi:sulfur-oxidizing protein SoxY
VFSALKEGPTLRAVLIAACCALSCPVSLAADDAASPDTDIWRKVRADLFADRAIEEAGTTRRLRIELPARAMDAAVVPLAIHAQPGPRRVWLIIDRNPSPLAGVFEFGESAATGTLETRVRIEQYTWLRVVAEFPDGSLLAAAQFVKAAGGCSAPAGKTLLERKAGMGQVRWRFEAGAEPEQGTLVQLAIRHPNSSGLAMDQVSRLYDPPHFVRNVKVVQGERLLFSADVDFSLSENPVFRFSTRLHDPAPLHATVTDSNGLVFEASAPMH